MDSRLDGWGFDELVEVREVGDSLWVVLNIVIVVVERS